MVFGELTLNNDTYHFLFDNYELRIHKFETSQSNYSDNISELLFGKPLELPEALKGICYPDSHIIYFMHINLTSTSNNVRILSVRSFFEIKNHYSFPLPISQISLCADELNFIYPPSLMYSQTINKERNITAINLTSPRQSYSWQFVLDDQKIIASSGFLHTYTWETTPVQIQSALYFSFSPTNNMEFIVRLFDMAYRLLQFLCYRQNIHCTKADMYISNEHEKHTPIGTFSAKWINELQPESTKRNLQKVIPFEFSDNALENILQRLADNTLYYHHLPYNNTDGHHITPARSIMLMAAFEWEFKHVYFDKKNNGSFKMRLIKALTDFSDCIEIFIKHRYSLNDKEYSIESTAIKIKEARNSFAHGDITINYDLDTLLGLSIMPYLIYAMQLRAAGLDTDNIRKAINQLFDQNLSV